LEGVLENIIKLGDPRLYVPSDPVSREEINSFHKNIRQMRR
jgi:hypothetical protein